MKPPRACDLCAGSCFEVLGRVDRKGQPLETVVCRACGLVSHAHVPTRKELAEYYAERYRHEYNGDHTPQAYRVVREWQRGKVLVERLQHDVPAGGKVLEIGSGIGCTVMNFCLAGFDASGIEPGEGFSAFSRDKLHANIQRCCLTDLPPVPENDLILLVHVLEHLPSPTEALSRIGKLLSASGKLYVEVPNFNAPHAAPGKQFHFAHIYNFTPATLRMAAGKTGYVVEHAYTSSRDKVIAMLLRKSHTAAFDVEGLSYDQTMEAARRYSRLGYYARLGYLLERGWTMTRHGLERLVAKQALKRILAECEAYHREQIAATAKVAIRRAA